MFTQLDAKNALLKVLEIKGKDRAQLLERMLRLETAHFASQQYKLTGSAGMEKGMWSNLDESKLSYIQMNDNHLQGAAKLRTFIKWNSVLDFCFYLSDYIDRWKGNYGRWNTTDVVKQQRYMNEIKKIKNRWIV